MTAIAHEVSADLHICVVSFIHKYLHHSAQTSTYTSEYVAMTCAATAGLEDMSSQSETRMTASYGVKGSRSLSGGALSLGGSPKPVRDAHL